MGTKGRLATILIPLTVFGCKGPMQTSAASAMDGANGGSSGASAATGSQIATKVAYITDPTLNNMNAVAVTIPSRWKLQGTLFQPGTCNNAPTVVFRAISPDGLSMEEQEPVMGWKWGSGPLFNFMPKNDCMPINTPMAAQDFLKYFAGTMKMNYVGSDPVPAAVNASAQQKRQEAEDKVAPEYAAHNMQPPKSSRELARAIVTYKKDGVAMKGRLHVLEDCSGSTLSSPPAIEGRPPRLVPQPPTTINTCTATVTFVAAPEAKFAEVLRGLDTSGMGPKMQDAWAQAWMQRSAQQTQNTINQMNAQSRDFMQRQQQQFEHDQSVRQDIHNQFMQSMNEQGERNRAQFTANMAAKDTVTSDYVDFALDRQTVQNMATGVVYKQPNDLPVGGNEVKVHGNGSPW
jgi:hypothetical protein